MTKKRKAVKGKKARRTLSKKTWGLPALKSIRFGELVQFEEQGLLEELTKQYQSGGMTLEAARQRAMDVMRDDPRRDWRGKAAL